MAVSRRYKAAKKGAGEYLPQVLLRHGGVAISFNLEERMARRERCGGAAHNG